MGKADGRIWKACLSCRRKKIKCDGEDPCHGCESRGQPCEFPDSNDNASASRRYATSLEERCQHMDDLCSRLENLAKNLTDCIQTAQRESQPTQEHKSSRLIQPIQQPPPLAPNSAILPVVERSPQNQIYNDSPSGRSGRSGNSQPQTYDSPVDQGHMIADSYGRLRYIGGATNKIMIEAVQSLSPDGAAAATRPTSYVDNSDVALPFFIQGQVWPELPYLPQPKELARPPQYVADLLIGIYFEQVHYTFPILYKPEFMRRYREMSAAKKDAPIDRGFLSVFFAVCACASGLLPRPTGSAPMPGIEFYQKALLLQFASVGEAFIEQVQCLGLLALCSAGWNTLSQSWRFAGQAVRLAQDLGLHVSSLQREMSMEDQNSSRYIEAHIARCIWWSVFGLDCLMSICLGRPMAADEADCSCDLPFDISNEDLENIGRPLSEDHHHNVYNPGGASPMTGFLAFIRLCRIAAQVHQLYSSKRRKCCDDTLGDDLVPLLPTVDVLVRKLDEWLDELPNDIRFSVNSNQCGPNLTMCVIVFILHSGTIMNLYRPLAGRPDLVIPSSPSSECLNAARSCIQAAELIRERVPPSHYLAFCVQYLTISGILLLNMADKNEQSTYLPDVENALRFLGDVEAIWPGASRSRSIIDRLLQNPPPRVATREGSTFNTMGFPSLPALDGLLWDSFTVTDADSYLNTL